MSTQPIDERAVKAIADNVYYADLGEEKVRRVAEACERVESAQLVNGGRWLNPATRIEILRILKPELRQISETHAWMVARRYRDLKRFYLEQERLAEQKKKDDEAKAKLAAAKAAKAKAAAVAAPAAAPAATAPGPSTNPAAGPAPSVPPPAAGVDKTVAAAEKNAGVPPGTDGTLHSPPEKQQDAQTKPKDK